MVNRIYDLSFLDSTSKKDYSPFLPLTARRNPYIFFSYFIFLCAINRRVAVSLFWFILSHEQVSFLVSTVSYKPFDSESFTVCEHVHICE